GLGFAGAAALAEAGAAAAVAHGLVPAGGPGLGVFGAHYVAVAIAVALAHAVAVAILAEAVHGVLALAHGGVGHRHLLLEGLHLAELFAHAVGALLGLLTVLALAGLGHFVHSLGHRGHAA